MKNIFYLQRNDRQALTVLLLTFGIAAALIMITGGKDSEKEKQTETAVSPKEVQKATREHPLYYKIDEIPHELFAFDPNTADSTDFIRLGLQPWQVRNIYHYRAKGGIYRAPEDFARLYGLTKKQYETLRPYIIIGEDYQPAANYYGQHSSYRDKRNVQDGSTLENGAHEERVYSYPQKLKAGEHMDINLSDTTELKKIPGIGSVFASRIVRYREKLGGFTHTSQLKEIEGFPEEALPYMQITQDGKGIKKLNVNKLPFSQLYRHPYINYYQAREICDYRRLKGPLKDLHDLSLLKDFPPAQIERLTPYVTFE